jgi:predicted Zn-dependent protease
VALARGYVTSGERLIYLSSAGFAWLGAMAFARATRGATPWRWPAFAAAAVLIGGGLVEILRTQPSWADDAHVFATMTRRQPDNPIGWVGYADVLAGRGKVEGAMTALSRAETLAPRLPAVPIGRARIHYQMGDWPGVLAETERALDLDETSFEARAMRASTLMRLHRTDEAAKEIRRLKRDQPDHPTSLTLEAQLLMAQGRVAEAAVPLAKAASITPNDPSLWFALAHAHAEAQDLRACRADLERGLQLAPNMGMGWMRLGEVCAALGDTAAAEVAIGRARSIMSRRTPSAPPGADSAAGGTRR